MTLQEGDFVEDGKSKSSIAHSITYSWNLMKYSLLVVVTACFDLNLLLWPGKQDFCAGSADTCQDGENEAQLSYDIFEAVENEDKKKKKNLLCAFGRLAFILVIHYTLY